MKESNDYLLLIWKDPQSRRNYTVGKLTRTEGFQFEYFDEFKAAEEAGWEKLSAFPKQQQYESKTMFPVFSSRLPDRKRRDLDKILLKYGMEEFDEYEMLKKSGARLPIDTYEFVDPIFPEVESVQRDFYVMGIRYYAPCKGERCEEFPPVKEGEFLEFEAEPDNPEDSCAIRVITQAGVRLGYVPRYYNRAILERLEQKMSYSCVVLEVNCKNDCSECVRVRLSMPRFRG